MDDTSKLADLTLVLRCQLGDERAFERLVAQYSDRLRYFVRRLVKYNEGEDDILQLTWLAVWSQLPKLRHPEAFRTWLYRIARNIALQDARRPATVELEENYAGPIEEYHEEFSKEEAAAVHAGLEKISPAHREVLMLRFLEGMPYAEIADVVECSLGTVRSRVHYAKISLREQMEDQENGSGQHTGVGTS